MIREDIRNIAIIAHVDHGKTTLVSEMLKQAGTFRENQVVEDRVMDSNDIERERGITILAKNTALHYKDVKINIVDTPGHADFGGEVERSLKMVDGVLLLVDSFEGTMPQTRFVLGRALELGCRIIVVINKMDRPDARLVEVGDEVLELLFDLDATEEQLESPIVYCSARQGVATLDFNKPGTDLTALFDKILEYIPAPEGDPEDGLQMLVSSIDYSEYVGRMATGRITRGNIKVNQEIMVCDYHQPERKEKGKVAALFSFDGLGKVPIQEASIGEIVCVAGIPDINIGETLCVPSNIEPLDFTKISAPTVEMTFSVNDSPFAGREGKFVTSRQLRERLYRETLKDVSLKVPDGDSAESFRVAGRGEMHLSVLIENMRRENYEFQVSNPRVLFEEIDGERHEPMEEAVIDVPEWASGAVIEKLSRRKGELMSMRPVNARMHLIFHIPARGLFGYRGEFLTDTKGEGVLNTLFRGYEPYKGDIPRRSLGSLISFETGEAITYGLYNAQERGTLFIEPGTPVYEGMIVGSNPRSEDLVVNVCKKKHVTNMRASGSDDALKLVPVKKMSLEEALEFLEDDELMEVTPKNIRLRKRILNHNLRAKAGNKK